MMQKPIRTMSVMYPKSVQQWTKKRGQYLISPKGRWGKNWPGLWWVVFHIAKNLGMVSHHRECLDGVRICEMNLSEAYFVDLIDKAVIPYLNDGYGLGDLIILIGSPEWPGLALELHETMRMQFGFPPGHKEYRDERARIFDVPVIVSPHVKGILVLPKSILR